MLLAQGWKVKTQLRRSTSGFLDPSGAGRPKKVALHTKCSGEARFFFDTALDNDEGMRLSTLERTGKKQVLCSHFEKSVKEEAKREKALSGNCLP